MKRLIQVLAAAFVASLTVLASFRESHAQERMETWPSGGVTPQRISMGVGKSRIIDLPRDAAEIFVANPRIANAVVRSPRKLYIIGMDAGQTSLYALDQQGRQIAAFELSIGRDIGELQQILHAAMPTAAITARTVNDTIILTGSVDSAEEAQRAGDIAQGFVQRSMVISAQAPGAPGESGATGAKFNGMVVNTLTIPADVWALLEIADWQNGVAVAPDGTEYWSIHVQRLAVEARSTHALASSNAPASPALRNKGGRPPAVDWDVVKTEVFRLMDYHEDFGPDAPEWNAQARLEEKVENFCDDKFGKRPARTTIQEHVAPWLAEWRTRKRRSPET